MRLMTKLMMTLITNLPLSEDDEDDLDNADNDDDDDDNDDDSDIIR